MISTRRDGDIGWIELGGERPFTIGEEFPGALEAAIAELRDGGAGALVLAGTTPVFCAGADLRLAPRLREPEFGRRWLTAQHTAIATLAACPLPTVAAVNGAAAGAGCNLAIACDHVVAAASAGFSQAFIRIGLATDMGSLFLLPRRVGPQAARELMLTGREVRGEEALSIGLADQLAPPEEVVRLAGKVAAERAAGPLAAYAAVKQGLARGLSMGLHDSLELEADLQMDVMAHPDFAEGSSAFLEKRPPRYRG